MQNSILHNSRKWIFACSERKFIEPIVGARGARQAIECLGYEQLLLLSSLVCQ